MTKPWAERYATEAPAAPGFFELVYAIVRRIPRGRVLSYGQIARMLGMPRMARQVGWAMRRCPDGLPWQRVVKADGSIARNGFSALRRALLEQEGVPFLPDGRIDMPACQWHGEEAPAR